MGDLEVMWWPRGKAFPEGWSEVTGRPKSHHDHWSVLIERNSMSPEEHAISSPLVIVAPRDDDSEEGPSLFIKVGDGPAQVVPLSRGHVCAINAWSSRLLCKWVRGNG